MNASSAAAELRRLAEARLRKQQRNRRVEVGERTSAADTTRLLHELQVHQIELEMQNAELQAARDGTEALLEQYTDLYDFAPVGYFSLDEQGRILEANLTGAALLGTERSGLISRYLSSFVAPEHHPIFSSFLKQVFSGPERPVCEVTLLKADGPAFCVNLHGTAAVSIGSVRKWCRVAVSDMTFLKQAQDAQQRLEAVSSMNQKLQSEIVRRQLVEDALQKSEQHKGLLLLQARHMQEQLQRLSHQMLQAQEEERKRISRELHDEIIQTLVGITILLETLTRTADKPAELKRKLAKMKRLVEKSLLIVHKFAQDLRPTTLDDLGLIAALHAFTKDFTNQTGIRVYLTTPASAWINELDTARRAVLYRVTQEALTNVARHTHANRIDIRIHKRPRAVRLTIKNNGEYFDVDRAMHGDGGMHLGLLGMRERVEMEGGRFYIESVQGKGTTIRAQIPFRSGAKKRTRP